jgi:hypothetical protein
MNLSILILVCHIKLTTPSVQGTQKAWEQSGNCISLENITSLVTVTYAQKECLVICWKDWKLINLMLKRHASR